MENPGVPLQPPSLVKPRAKKLHIFKSVFSIIKDTATGSWINLLRLPHDPNVSWKI